VPYDAKIYNQIFSSQDKEHLQHILTKLKSWAKVESIKNLGVTFENCRPDGTLATQIIIIIINEFQSSDNGLQGRLQGRCHVSCDVQ